MNQEISELIKDPLFQLNLAIWLALPQPIGKGFVYPLFHKSGLSVYLIGRLLSLPPSTKLKIAEESDFQDGAKPDIILEKDSADRICLLECKASSFAEDYKAARQARALLLIVGPILSEVLGLQIGAHKEGILCYLTGWDQTESLEQTLMTLNNKIMTKTNLITGDFGCFGLKPTETGLLLDYPDKVKRFLSIHDEPPVKIMDILDGTDPRFYYSIPYDPTVSQSEREGAFSRRLVFDKELSYIIAAIGEAAIPSSVVLTIDDILNFVTSGLYDKWVDNQARKPLKKMVRDYVTKIFSGIGEMLRNKIRDDPNRGWAISLEDHNTKEIILNHLMKFKPETLDFSERVLPGLFDE